MVYTSLPCNFTPALEYTMFEQSLVVTIYQFIFLHWQSEQILVSMKHLQQEIHQYQTPCLAPHNWLLLQNHHKRYEFHWQLYLIPAYSAILLVSCEPLGPEIKVNIYYKISTQQSPSTQRILLKKCWDTAMLLCTICQQSILAGTTTC